MTATLLIVLLTAGVSWAGFSNPRVIQALLVWPPAVRQKSEFYRLVTYGVVHGDWMHLLFNMVTLYFFGNAVERFFNQQMGQLGFVFFYVLALIVSILPTYVTHRADPDYRSLGASGGVSAVLFAFVLFQPWQVMYVFFVPMPAIVYAVLFVAYSIWSQKKGTDNVNHSAHLWGAAFGVVFTLLLAPPLWGQFLRDLFNP